MPGKMTILGTGHKIALVTLPVFVFSTVPGRRGGDFFCFGGISTAILLGTGTGLMIIGLGVTVISAVAITGGYRCRSLLTKGIYGFCRHPMYASFIFLTIPGLSLVLNCWLVFAASAVSYTATAFLVGEEEQWLARRFGDEWERYTRRVGRIMPKVW